MGTNGSARYIAYTRAYLFICLLTYLLCFQVVRGRLEAVCLLLNCRGIDVNCYNNDGWTALHLAAEMGHLELLKLFIASKAYVECQTKYGRTPLHWACCRGHVQVNHGLEWYRQR